MVGVAYDEAMWLFYTNLHDEKYDELSFSTMVYGVRIAMHPIVIYEILGIPQVENEVIYLVTELVDKYELTPRLWVDFS